MRLCNYRTERQRDFFMPMTMYFFFGAFYFLPQLMFKQFFKHLVLDALTLMMHRHITVFFLPRILRNELGGSWEIEKPPSIIDKAVPIIYVAFTGLSLLLSVLTVLFD